MLPRAETDRSREATSQVLRLGLIRFSVFGRDQSLSGTWRILKSTAIFVCPFLISISEEKATSIPKPHPAPGQFSRSRRTEGSIAVLLPF